MRLIAILAVAAMVPLAGCFHAVEAAGLTAEARQSNGYTLKDSKSETRAGLAKVETRQYERADLSSGYATLVVVTVTEVPVLTARAVGAVADQALANYDAKETGAVEVDFTGAGAGKVQATEFEVTQSGQKGKGFRAEFSCTDGYVLVFGAGADLPISGVSGGTMYANVLKAAKDVTCTGGA